jgi:hypothetical protein
MDRMLYLKPSQPACVHFTRQFRGYFTYAVAILIFDMNCALTDINQFTIENVLVSFACVSSIV